MPISLLRLYASKKPIKVSSTKMTCLRPLSFAILKTLSDPPSVTFFGSSKVSIDFPILKCDLNNGSMLHTL